MAENGRDIPLSALPELELLRVLEDIDPIAMGVGHRKSIPENRQLPHINRKQLEFEHPEYFGVSPVITNVRHVRTPREVVRQITAGQLSLSAAFARSVH